MYPPSFRSIPWVFCPEMLGNYKIVMDEWMDRHAHPYIPCHLCRWGKKCVSIFSPIHSISLRWRIAKLHFKENPEKKITNFRIISPKSKIAANDLEENFLDLGVWVSYNITRIAVLTICSPCGMLPPSNWQPEVSDRQLYKHTSLPALPPQQVTML